MLPRTKECVAGTVQFDPLHLIREGNEIMADLVFKKLAELQSDRNILTRAAD